MPDDEMYEMCQSKIILEKIIQKSIHTYIYPSGGVNELTSEHAAFHCGYALAWSTHFWTDWNIHPQAFAINRIRIGPNTTSDFFVHLATQKESEKILEQK
jgi:hypothetical protein